MNGIKCGAHDVTTHNPNSASCACGVDALGFSGFVLSVHDCMQNEATSK